MTVKKLSLAAAVLVTVNIVIGSGIFINSVLLAKLAGPGSALTYMLVGLLILPLMGSFMYLARLHHGGSLYTYGATLSPYAGFMSMWGYCITKLASCAVALHVCATLLQSIIPALNGLSVLQCDMLLLVALTCLNAAHVHVGKGMQVVVTLGKLVPIGTVLLVGVWYVRSALVVETLAAPMGGIFSGVPFVLYAFMGFEAATGLNRRLANPQRDGWRVMVYAFLIGVSVTTLFQWLLFGTVTHLEHLDSYRDLFPTLLAAWHVPPSLYTWFLRVLHGGIAASAAGVAFGILYANLGNLQELAERQLLPACVGNRIAQSALYALIVEASIVAGYLVLGSSSIPVLQQLAALGATWTYLISVVALYRYGRGTIGSMETRCGKVGTYQSVVPLLAIASCSVLLAAAFYNFFWISKLPVILFVVLQLIGAVPFLTNFQGYQCQ